MSVQAAKDFLQKLEAEPGFKAKFQDAPDQAARHQLAKAEGFDFSMDEFKQAVKEITAAAGVPSTFFTKSEMLPLKPLTSPKSAESSRGEVQSEEEARSSQGAMPPIQPMRLLEEAGRKNSSLLQQKKLFSEKFFLPAISRS